MSTRPGCHRPCCNTHAAIRAAETDTHPLDGADVIIDGSGDVWRLNTQGDYILEGAKFGDWRPLSVGAIDKAFGPLAGFDRRPR